MKRNRLLSATAAALAASMLFSSCIGSFSLTNKLLSWNNNVGDKFTNEVVFFLFWILPAYEVSLVADLFVLNSIEFWSGSNPVAQGTRVIEGNDGRYLVECDGAGYTIKSETDGSVVRLDFDASEQSWSVRDAQGTSHVFLTFVDDTHVALPGADGGMHTVELSQQGLYAYQQMVGAPVLALAR